MCHTGFPVERRDYSPESVEITFEPNTGYRKDILIPVPIFDDAINEAEEVFVVVLELVDAVNPGTVDLKEINATLCKILDNDRKYITVCACRYMYYILNQCLL